MIAHDETADGDSTQHGFDDAVDVVDLGAGVELRNHAAECNTATDVHGVEGGHELLAADVVEVHIDAVGGRPPQQTWP